MNLHDRQLVVAEAKSWLGTPYHPHGRLKGIGVDCAMLPAAVYHACGLVEHIDPGNYPVDWHLHRSEERYLSIVLQYAKEVDSVQPGDLVLYKWGRCFAHGAIVIQWPTIIHAFIREGVVMADGMAGRLKDRECKFFTVDR